MASSTADCYVSASFCIVPCLRSQQQRRWVSRLEAGSFVQVLEGVLRALHRAQRCGSPAQLRCGKAARGALRDAAQKSGRRLDALCQPICSHGRGRCACVWWGGIAERLNLRMKSVSCSVRAAGMSPGRAAR